MLQNQKKVRFGLYIADLHTSELRRGQDIIPVQNLPFRILALLLREPGRVVTREEIRQELWPADTFVDYERGISTAVSKLREALKDSASNPRFIETVGRRGYRFIAPVTVVRSSGKEAVSEDASLASTGEVAVRNRGPLLSGEDQRVSLSRRIIFIAAMVVVLAAFIVAFDSISRTEFPKILRVTELTSDGKIDNAGDLHTDGTRLYFLQRVGPKWMLAQTSMGGGEATTVQLPIENPRLLGISPDRTEMLMTVLYESPANRPLWIIPLQGGALRRVGDVLVDDATWFPDGKRILCAAGNEVFSVERDGSHRRHLFYVDGMAFRFAWKPDGSSLRFTVGHSNNTSDLWESSPDGLQLHPLLPAWKDKPYDCCGTWSPDGRNYVFYSAHDGHGDLWLRHESPGFSWIKNVEPVRLTSGPNSFIDAKFSQNGKKIFAFGIRANGFIAQFDSKQRDYTPFPLPASAFDLDFSPDGKWVAYIAPPDLTLWRSRIDGSDVVQLTAAPVAALRPRWSPDGKTIAFIRREPKEFFAVYTVPAQGGEAKPVLPNDGIYRDYVDFSADGESVVIGNEQGMYPDKGITVVNLKTKQVSEIPGSKGLLYPRYVPDRQKLVAVSQDGKSILLFDAHSEQWKQVAKINGFYKFANVGREFYFQDIFAPGQAVFHLDPKTGKAERVFDFSRLLREGAMRCAFQGGPADGPFIVTVSSSRADLFAFDVELP